MSYIPHIRELQKALASASHLGPRMGLGGWGFPATTASLPVVEMWLGYCVEKLNLLFSTLRGLCQTERELKVLSMQTGRLGLTVPPISPSVNRAMWKNSTKPWRLEDALQALQASPCVDSPELIAFFNEESLLRHLSSKEVEQVILSLKNLAVQSPTFTTGLLSLLRIASSRHDFIKWLGLLGDIRIIQQRLTGLGRGGLAVLFERFQIIPWCVPFSHPIFDEVCGMQNNPLSSNHGKTPSHLPVQESSRPLIREAFMEKFVIGETNASSMMGLSAEDLEQISHRGFTFVEKGHLETAQIIFDGLIYLSPHHAYFYAALGAIRQRQQDFYGALACYNQALLLQPDDIATLTNRGETWLALQRPQEATRDFLYVLKLDPSLRQPSTLRVGSLLRILQQSISQAA